MRFLEFIKKLTLGARLNILAFAIFSLLLMGMVLATNDSMDSFMLQAGRQNVGQAAETVQLRFEEIETEILNNVAALSRNPKLFEALKGGDVRPVQSEILIEAARLDFDDTDVVNTDGKRLFDTNAENSADEERLIKLALLGFDATGIVMEAGEGEIAITAAVPISDESGTVIGAVVGGRAIDDEMLLRVNSFSGHNLDIVLIVNGAMTANEFETAEELEAYLPILLEANSIGEALNGRTVIGNELIASPSDEPHIFGHAPLTIGADTRAVIGLAVNMGELAAAKGGLISNQRAVFAFFAIIGNIILAFFATYEISRPIRQLQKAADKMAQGDYSQRVITPSQNEVGLLTSSFNSMAEQLQNLVTGLEERVAQRTSELERHSAELEQTSQESKKRASDLQTIAEIGQYLSTEKELELLLPLITRTVSERFGFYHVGIFLLNDSRKYAILRAANSPGGQRMLARQHKLEVGQTGIVGYVTDTGNPRVALDTGADAVFFNNPDLPDTHSEMALPLIARGTIIGALDVQSTVPNAFTDADVSTLSLLADQIAIAIDNVRLIAEAQDALEEARSLSREYLADAWQKKSTAEVLGYYQSLAGGQLLTNRQPGKTIDAAVVKEGALAVPIKLRDQVIGTINIRPNTGDRNWSADEVNIVNAITERLGLALDNARLFEETTRRAEREHLVSDITTKIRSTTDPQEMIKTAVEELKRALGVNRIEVVPQKVVPPPDK
ncbi:MAG: GAF domain-containing protein [Chloroflexi bacterium]|nr:GAF domain-containing protein [Chloroflexota bacterium]